MKGGIKEQNKYFTVILREDSDNQNMKMIYMWQRYYMEDKKEKQMLLLSGSPDICGMFIAMYFQNFSKFSRNILLWYAVLMTLIVVVVVN